MEEICTICVTKPNIYFDINGSFFGSSALRLREVIQTCIPEIECHSDDFKIVCQNCASCLCLFYQFRSDALKNQEKLVASEIPDEKYLSKELNLKICESPQLSEMENTLDDDEEDDKTPTLNEISADVLEYEILSGTGVVKNEHNYTLSNEFIKVENECDAQNDSKNSVMSRRSKKAQNFKFACHSCPYRTVCKSQLEIHMRIHTGEKPYHCHYCPYKAKRKAHLQDHLKTHTGERPYSCELCDKRFPTKGMLSAHLDAHSTNKNHTCPQCDFKTNNRASLYGHVKRKHSEKPKVVERNFICNYCGKRFIARQTLKIHLETHTGQIKRYMCEKCGHCFRDTGILKSHILTHSNERPFACDNCDYKANRKAHLQEHMKTHLEYIKLVDCSFCDKQFSTKRLATTHMQEVHTPAKIDS